MKQVLFDCERTKYPNTGLYQFCLQLGKALAPLADPSKEKIIYYLPASRVGLFGPGEEYEVQRTFHKFFHPNPGNIDVWHSTSQASAYGPRDAKVKMVLTVHDLNFLVEKKSTPGKISRYLRQVEKQVRRADYLVCISHFTQQTLQSHIDTGQTPVKVVYNGCTIHEFPGFDKPPYRPSQPYIFTVGTVVPKKNFHVLPRLLRNNKYELLIAGSINQYYGSSIMESARKEGVESRVRLLGPITEEAKYWYYKNCLCFAFPSIAEGFGLPVIEAMYYGKPVFVSRFSSLPEIAGNSAYYFSSFERESMQEVFEGGLIDYDRNTPAERIRAHALQFSWKKAADQYLEIYRSLY